MKPPLQADKVPSNQMDSHSRGPGKDASLTRGAVNIAAWRFSHKCDVCGKAVSYVGHKSVEGYTTVCYLCDEHAPRLNLLTTAPEPDYRWHGLVFIDEREMDRIMRRLWRDYWEASFERDLEGVL